MKNLSKEFIGIGAVRGFVFMQLKATDEAYLYQVNDKGKIHYEVFKKRINERFGNVSYPSTKAFGVWAWCIRDYQQAITKFNELKGR